MMEIVDISSFNDLKLSGKSCLLFFYAKWQEETLNADLKNLVVAMSAKYPQITFCSVEAEHIPELSEVFRVSVVPTFVAIKGGETVGKVEGANPADLSKLVKQLSALQSQSAETGKLPSSGHGTTSNIETTLKNLINTAPVMLFMKGSPAAPRCGFSRQITEILSENKVPYASFDILTNESVREALKKYSDWPTYPQLYVSGELIGGLDILKEIASSGNLASELGIDKLKVPPKMPTLEERLVSLINQAPVMIFIKGSPDAPQCGFSRTLVGLLREEKIEFSSFDILRDEDVRAGLKTLSDWPTYPQLYVKGEFMGGLDIIKEMQADGSLRGQLGVQ